MDDLMFVLKLLAALGCGIMAGIFFTFSNFVMKALAALPPNAGMTAMKNINITIINLLFMLVFIGTTVVCLVSLLLGLLRWGESGSTWLVVGSVVYLVGCFLITGLCNVPLNDALATADSNGTAIWTKYLTVWTTWNHVRTVAASMAALAFMLSQTR